MSLEGDRRYAVNIAVHTYLSLVGRQKWSTRTVDIPTEATGTDLQSMLRSSNSVHCQDSVLQASDAQREIITLS